MRKILFIAFLFICFFGKAQSNGDPAGFPTLNSAPYYKYSGYLQIADNKGFLNSISDTNWHPRYAGTQIYKAADSSIYWWTGNIWVKAAGGSGGSTTFFGLSDVDSSGIQDGWIPYYDLASGNMLFTPQGITPDITITWSVLDSLNTPPVSPTTGDIYEVGTVPTGVWVGHAGDIATYNGATWDFDDPSQGDLLYNAATDFVSKYVGSTWVRIGKGSIHQGLDRYGANLKVGTADNFAFGVWTNNIQRFNIANNGQPRFYTLTGASAGLAGLATNGVMSNVQVGTGLQLLAGVLSSTVSGGVTTADNGVNLSTATNVQWGGSLLKNTTVDGAFTATLSPSRVIINVSDSIQLAASNDIGITSLGTTRVTAATITAKASTATFGSATKSIYHYETGTSDSIALELKSVGARWVGITTINPSAADKPLQMDTVTGLMQRKLIDVSLSSQITGVGTVPNGFTGLATLTANSLLVGNGTSAVTFIAPGTSGNVLTSNGTTWASTASATNYWQRAAYTAVASTNIIQLATANATDSTAIGNGITAFNGKHNFGGNVYFQDRVAMNTTQDATYRFVVNGNIKGFSNLRIDGGAIINSAADVVAGQALTVTGSSIASIVSNMTPSTNSTNYNANVFNVNNAQTTAAGSNVGLLIDVNNNSDGSSTQTSALYKGMKVLLETKSNSTTPITTVNGYDFQMNVLNSRTQTFTTAYGYLASKITGFVTGGILTTGGNYYEFYADSSNSTSFANGSMFGFYQLDNTAKNINNVFQGKTSHGTTTTPTAFVMLGAGTTAAAPLRFVAGVAPTSPNDGDHWYEDTNDRLMFRQNATSVEIPGISAVSSVTPTLQNRTLTIIYNGVTYYITAKTTND